MQRKPDMNTEANAKFDEMIDSCYPAVVICGITFSPSSILRKLDPIAYDCAVSDAGYDEEDEEEQE